ncbi:hypothetical protein CKA32_001259 [Geitlerinema sp. FC II]|nr:hypothetical protein CKA32_001259 [Geitlerinema sp. FC II]
MKIFYNIVIFCHLTRPVRFVVWGTVSSSKKCFLFEIDAV